MASPGVIGAAGLGTSLIGGLIGAKGAQEQGAAQQQMYNYRAQVAKINSDIDKQNAEWTRSQGDIQAAQYGMKASQQFGAIRAAQGASGLDVNSGSNAEVQASQKKITALDLGQIRANAAKTAYDYDVKSTIDLNQVGLETISGVNAERVGEINAATSILGTVSSVSSKWAQGKQAGMWS